MKLQENILFHDRYRLLKFLGPSGFFSEDWLVEDAKTNMIVVLKVYAPGTGLDEDGVKLFSREFSIVFNFNHRNLLRPSHFDVCDRMPYLILPFCKHDSAAKLVGKISEEEAWKFLHDVAAGLSYLHMQNPPVIHPINPGNVMIDNTGQFMITNFGISAKIRNTLRKSVGEEYISGAAVAYMGPERFSGHKTPPKASDIWALGATLYELLVGDTPFGNEGGLRQKIGTEIPHLQGNYSAELKDIIYRCLSTDPLDRPTADTLVEWALQHKRSEKNPVVCECEAVVSRDKANEVEPRPNEGIGIFNKINYMNKNLESNKQIIVSQESGTDEEKQNDAMSNETVEQQCSSGANDPSATMTEEQIRQIANKKYDNVRFFSDGLAAVKLNGMAYGKWGFIDKTGKEVIPFKYDDAWRFSEGLAAVKLNGKWGFIDKTGKKVIPSKYGGAWRFSEGLAAVKLNGKWGFIDKTGKKVIPSKYDYALNFSEGLALVELNGKWGFIDKTGNEVIPLKYDGAWSFSEGLAAVELNGKWGFIDKTGTEAIPFKYDHAWSFFGGFACVNLMNGEEFYIDKTGKQITESKCAHIHTVYYDGKYCQDCGEYLGR
jgi:serine/threonine protein kinase